MIIVGVPAAGEFVIPEILGGGKTLMIGNIVANQFLEVSNYPFGAALAMSLMVVLVIAVFSLRRVPSRAPISNCPALPSRSSPLHPAALAPPYPASPSHL